MNGARQTSFLFSADAARQAPRLLERTDNDEWRMFEKRSNDSQHTRRESPKKLSRPLARERDITSRSEPRCRRQLHKAGRVFSLPRRLLLASAASNPTTVLSARVLSARVIPTASLCASCLFLLAWDRASIPARTRQKSPGLCPDPPLPLAAFRVTGRVRTTRAPSAWV